MSTSSNEFIITSTNESLATVPVQVGACSAPYTVTPLAAFKKLSHASSHAFLLENSAADNPAQRFSIIGIDPAVTISFKESMATVSYRNGKAAETLTISDPLQLLKGLMEDYHLPLNGSPEHLFSGFEHIPFVGGLVGYMGYGSSHYFEGTPLQENDPLAVPDAYYGLYDSCLVFDQLRKRLTAVSLQGNTHAQTLLSRASDVDGAGMGAVKDTSLSRKLSADEIFNGVEATFSKASYLQTIKRAKEFIEQGQTFQIVVSQRYDYPTEANPIDIYRILQDTNPSPYGYYLKFPNFVYLGSSPETFLQCEDNHMQLFAIAGTRPRGVDAPDDLRLEEELLHNEKEMAEHMMLVDLGRNDLGRVSVPGSVGVGNIAELSRYSHVMHLVTRIEGELAPQYSIFDAFRSCFPAGTVSGAPKIRAMELLSELEPEQRGIYAGAVGYFDLRGNVDSAIAIRSALIKDGVAHVNAGGGVVYDSQPDMEYEESRHKAKAILQAIKIADRSMP